MRRLVATIVLVCAGCGGADAASVELSVAQRVDVGATEDAYAAAGGIAIDGGIVWATKPNEGELVKIEAATGTIEERIAPCTGANDVAVDASGVYVACEGTGAVLRLDREGNVTGHADVGVKALGLALTDDAIWVSNRDFDDLVRVDPRTMEVVARIDTGQGAWDVAATKDAVWVTTQSLEVARIDPGTNKVVARVPTVTDEITLSLHQLAVGEDGVWLTSADSLARLDPDANEIADVTPLETAGAGHVAVVGEKVWVSASTEVIVVDAPERSVSGRLAVVEGSAGAGLRGIAATSDGSWVVNPGDGQVVHATAAVTAT